MVTPSRPGRIYLRLGQSTGASKSGAAAVPPESKTRLVLSARRAALEGAVSESLLVQEGRIPIGVDVLTVGIVAAKRCTTHIIGRPATARFRRGTGHRRGTRSWRGRRGGNGGSDDEEEK